MRLKLKTITFGPYLFHCSRRLILYPLSLYFKSISVVISAAVFKVMLCTCHIILLIKLSNTCRRSSFPLKNYVNLLNKHFGLAVLYAPHSLRWGFKHFSYNTGVVFAFLINYHMFQRHMPSMAGKLLCNLLQCATPVGSCLVRHKIQHTAHLSPCGILNLVLGFCPFHLKLFSLSVQPL